MRESLDSQGVGGQVVLVTGGAGFIGSVLVEELLASGAHVTVLDRFFFGNPLQRLSGDARLRLIEGDIRISETLEAILEDGRFDSVIHLAAISNDPCSEIDAELTRSVNKTAVDQIIEIASRAGVKRFLYASSASVYGIKDTEDVTEDLALEPITLYARYKAEGEETLWRYTTPEFCGAAVRAATVCGWSPRLRLDLTINILTAQALSQGALRVFGGSQMRPNIHIRDLTAFYRLLLAAPAPLINGQAFNVSYSNATVMELAEMIRGALDPKLAIDVVPTEDHRSYHLSAERAQRVLGYSPRVPLLTAVSELEAAFSDGRVVDPGDPVYRNVDLMKRDPEPWRHLLPASSPSVSLT